MTDQITEHYERVAASYDEHWTYDPDYVHRFSQSMIDALRLTADDAIADIGCGTGLFTRHLGDALRPTRPILCVDPVATMLERVPDSPGLRRLRARADDIADGRVAIPDGRPLDAIIIKEAVHHMSQWRDTFAGLVARLSGRGRILCVLLPRRIQHPLFRAAHERFGELQPDPGRIAEVLGAVGLKTSVSYRTFHVAIERERYVRMLEERYMSVLSEFTEDELNAGIAQFRRAYRDPIIRFEDHFAFVKGSVPHRCP